MPVGCSAALAAGFNTPIAAVLFSLEEIVGLFHVPAYQLVHPAEFGIYAILGVAAGLSSDMFRQGAARDPRAISEISEMDRVVAARCRWIAGRPDRVVCSGGARRRL